MKKLTGKRWPALLCSIIAALGLLAGFSAWAEEFAVGGNSLDWQFTSLPGAELEGIARTWVHKSAQAVATYYGSFPARHAVVRITAGRGREAKDGHASGWNGSVIDITLGKKATDADLADDWMLTHEMLHLCFPDLAEEHHWLEEGLATYVEPIARARVGIIKPERVWSDLVRDLPQGLPEAGDRGLDHTHTWGRTYWGGALFCLRADVEMRRRSGNRHGLEDALRAIAAAGGTIEHSWKMDRVIAVGDGAVGAPVLRELYDEMKDKPVQVDLPALWKQLGVVKHGDTVIFDDHAPLAAIRKAIAGG